MKKSLSGLGHKQVIKAFQKAGWSLREGGSHTVLFKDGYPLNLTVPRHNPVKQFLLKKLIKTAGMTEEEFLDFLYLIFYKSIEATIPSDMIMIDHWKYVSSISFSFCRRQFVSCDSIESQNIMFSHVFFSYAYMRQAIAEFEADLFTLFDSKIFENAQKWGENDSIFTLRRPKTP